MGFFEVMKRMMQGKPVFDVGQPGEHTAQDGYENPHAGASKQVPVVRIERTHCHNNGHHMQVRCHIKNESHQRVLLDKIFILGQKRELDTWLRPEEARDFVVYDGNRPNHQNYHNFDLNFTDEQSDYFQVKGDVFFKPEPDKTYSVLRLTQAGAIKDIQ